MGRIKQAIRSGWSWAIDQAIEHWPTILTVIGGGGVMTYLASVSTWLAPYGPVAWGGVAIASTLVLSFAFFLFSAARARGAMADYTKAKGTISSVNVLAPTHENEKINLSDFYHPFYRATENVRFENCDIFGPANIAVDGCSFLHGGFRECEIVIVRDDRPVVGAMMFRHCTFVRFRLYRATFLMNIQTYNALPADMRAAIRVVSDGRIGDI